MVVEVNFLVRSEVLHCLLVFVRCALGADKDWLGLYAFYLLLKAVVLTFKLQLIMAALS